MIKFKNSLLYEEILGRREKCGLKSRTCNMPTELHYESTLVPHKLTYLIVHKNNLPTIL